MKTGLLKRPNIYGTQFIDMIKGGLSFKIVTVLLIPVDQLKILKKGKKLYNILKLLINFFIFDRYYEVTKVLLELREEKSHPLYNYEYQAEKEKVRKYELEKYMMRNKEHNEEEKKIMEELRIIQNLIKKEEKDQNNIKRVL